MQHHLRASAPWIALFLLLSFSPLRATLPPDTPRIVGYFAEWQSLLPVEKIPADRLTHLNYAFAVIKDGLCDFDNRDLALKHFAALRSLKQKFPHLKTLLSVGGWAGSPPFSDVALTSPNRQRFAQSCARFAHEYAFDGIDIDWEFPCGGGIDPKVGRPEDTPNFTLLLQQLRQTLDQQGLSDHKHYLLTIAASARPNEFARLELNKIHPYLDFINVMTYDFVSTGSPLTDHNAPLFSAHPDDPASPSADATLQAFLTAGVPPDKLLLGIPFYGHAFGGVPNLHHGLFQPHPSPPPSSPTAPPNDWSYRSLTQYYINQGPERYWDPHVQTPWLYNSHTGLMITYDDPQSLRLKAHYARTHHLGGVMFWELSQDDPQSSLLSAIHNGLLSP